MATSRYANQDAGPSKKPTSMYANQDSGPSKKPTSIYADPDPTQRVIYAKRRVQSRADTEDGGQHIYESVDIRSYEDDPEPQEDVAGRQGQSSTTVKTLIAVAVCMGMLLVVSIGLVVHYKSAYGQSHINHHNVILERNILQTYYDNLTLERNILQTNYDNLTLERNILQTNYDNLTLERNILQTNYDNLTLERNILQTIYDNLTLARSNLLSKYDNMTLERNLYQTSYNNLTPVKQQLEREFRQFKKDAAVPVCPRGWQKFGCSCYFRSTEEKSWEESREQCRKTGAGADLVIINSDEEQVFIKGLPLGGEYWIGLKRTTDDGWKWVDGSPVTIQYWSSGRADLFLDWNCAIYKHSDGEWTNKFCSKTHTAKWICEM